MADEEFHEFLRKNAERYEEIKHLGDRITYVNSGYAHANYSVSLDDETKKLSDHDLVILCDRGNACFGGSVSRSFGTAAVRVHTD